jgi:hypothetical protein
MKARKKPAKIRLQILVSVDTVKALKRKAADRLIPVSRVIEDWVSSWKKWPRRSTMKRKQSIEEILKSLSGSIVFVNSFSQMSGFSPIFVRRVLRKLTRLGLAFPKPNPSDPKRVAGYYLLPVLHDHPFTYKNQGTPKWEKEKGCDF